MRPPRLSAGETVALISPSAGLAARYPVRFARATGALKAAGYEVEIGAHAADEISWVSGTAAERLADLHDAFAAKHVRAVMATIGGNHSAQLLEALDFDLIRRNPKVFCGYSDITSLLLAIHQMTGLVTFYGPAALPQFGEWPEPFSETVSHFQLVTEGTGGLDPLPSFETVVTEFVDWAADESKIREREPATGRRVLREGSAEGILLVGCLPTVRHLIGTPWEPAYDGRILALDIPDLGYDLSDVDADLWHLRNRGILARLAGLVIGRLRVSDPAAIHRLCGLAEEITRPFGYPVVAQFELGHSDPVLTLPIGMMARLDGAELAITDVAVC